MFNISRIINIIFMINIFNVINNYIIITKTLDTLSGIHFAPSKRCCFRGPFVNDVPLSFEVSFMCSQATKSAGQTMSSPVSTANPRDISDWSMLTGTCLKCDSLDPKIHLKFHTLVVQAGLSPCP